MPFAVNTGMLSGSVSFQNGLNQNDTVPSFQSASGSPAKFTAVTWS